MTISGILIIVVLYKAPVSIGLGLQPAEVSGPASINFEKGVER